MVAGRGPALPACRVCAGHARHTLRTPVRCAAAGPLPSARAESVQFDQHAGTHHLDTQAAHQRQAATSVPPVASTSSMMLRGHRPAVHRHAPRCSRCAFERVFLAQHLARQLARLAHRHEAHPSSSAIAAPRMKPRDSMPTTASSFWSRHRSAIAVIAPWKSPPWASSGMMSLNRMPGLGKSAMSRRREAHCGATRASVMSH